MLKDFQCLIYVFNCFDDGAIYSIFFLIGPLLDWKLWEVSPQLSNVLWLREVVALFGEALLHLKLQKVIQYNLAEEL